MLSRSCIVKQVVPMQAAVSKHAASIKTQQRATEAASANASLTRQVMHCHSDLPETASTVMLLQLLHVSVTLYTVCWSVFKMPGRNYVVMGACLPVVLGVACSVVPA